MKRQQENSNQFLQGFYDELGYNQSQLKWAPSPHNLVISGLSDYSALSKLKNVILSLRQDFSLQSERGISIANSDSLEKRLLLAQGEIDGLLRKKINYSVKSQNGEERQLDYSNLLNEKENQIVELQKKIQNLEQKLRRAFERERQLEDHLVKLSEESRRKEDLISLKHNSAVAQLTVSTILRENILKIKKNIEIHRYKIGDLQKVILDGVNLNDMGSLDIRSDIFLENSFLIGRSRVIDQKSQNQRYKIKLSQFFRQFERLCNQQQGITDFQVQRILQGFLLNMNQTKLYEKMQYSIERYRLNQNYKRLGQNFGIAAGMYSELVSQLRKNQVNVYGMLSVEVQNVFELLRRQKVVAFQVKTGAIYITQGQSAKVVEIPIQDARTKHLIHLLAHQLKKIFLKYPKLQNELDERLIQFLQQEIIDVIQADEIQKLIQIVKFVPQIVKVQNVYTHSTEKQRKVEFHLRILIKALLEELQKIKNKTGLTLELDEGVIGMINAEIMHVVNVDDILKIFRVSPKLVEVEKIIEKIVERIVQVPKVITVDKIVEKIVQVQRIKEVERIVYVPLETPLVVQTSRQRLVPYQNKIETIVQVPTIVQKFIELHTQVPKIVQIQVFKDKIVQVQVPVQVERIVNHIQTQIQQIQVVIEKIVHVQRVIEKLIEVPVFVEKIVERIIEVPRIIEVQKVVQKIVPVIQYRSARQVVNNIEIRYEIIQKIVQKIVPVIQIRQKIKEVPQIIQVIKQVNNVITQIKEVEVVREKLVIQEVIKQVQRVEIRFVEVIKEVIKEVQRYIEIPIIREVPVIREIIIEKPIISRIESVHIKQVIVKEPLIIKEPTIIEIQKFTNVYVDVPKTVKYYEERIVQVPTIVYRIKEVPVLVEKIIQKMVEVPKVVQVEKIVQKIIVVPRVIQKVVEVPQFVQKIIQKEVIRQIIKFVEKIIQVPVIQQRFKEIQIIRNVYIQKQIPVQKRIEITVEVPRFQEKIITKEVLREVPINIIHEIPRDLQVQKIVPQIIQNIRPMAYTKQIIVPIEIPVPVQIIKEKIVPREQIIERIISVPQVIEKIVPVVQEVIQFRDIEKIIQRIIIEKRIEQVEKIVPYIQEIIKEVPTIIEKIVPIETKVEQIVIAQQIIEKVIEKIITIPQIYEVEKIRQKVVEVPKLIEVERIIPQIVRVNQYIQKIVQKIVHVPTIIQKLKEVTRDHQRIVQTKHQKTQIIEVQKSVQKLVYVQKLKEVVRNVNYIQKVLQIIDRIEQIPISITTTQEKFIEVPFILQKIVEKIIIMPQIVEVLKYVHEVCEVEDAGVCVDVEFGAHQAKYKALTKKIEFQLDSLIKELRFMKSDQQNRSKIQNIERFLQELKIFILVPRIVKVTEQKFIQRQVKVDKFVHLQVQDERSIKMQLSLTVLIQKLINELKRIKQKTSVNIELDDDIKLIFFAQINLGVNLNNQMQEKLKSYSSYIQRQFESLGSWTRDHQLMLNSFLQERFLMAQLIQNANIQIENAKAISDQRMQGLKAYRNDSTTYSNLLNRIEQIFTENRPLSELHNVVLQYKNHKHVPLHNEKTHILDNVEINSERIQSILRQKDTEINMLKDRLSGVYQKNQGDSNHQQESVVKLLKKEIDNLRNENNVLLSKTSDNGLLDSFRQQIGELQRRNFELETEISRLKSDNFNKDSEIKLLLKNISFKKEPEAAFQQIDLRQINQRSRLSESSQGQSLIESRSRAGQIGNFTSSVYVPQGQSNFIQATSVFQSNKANTSQKYRDNTGVKYGQSSSNVRQGSNAGLQSFNLYQSGIQKASPYENLYRSQRKDQNVQNIGANSPFNPPVQSGFNTSVTGSQFNQQKIQNFGVQESNNLRSSQNANLYPGSFSVNNNNSRISDVGSNLNISRSNMPSQIGSLPMAQQETGQSLSRQNDGRVVYGQSSQIQNSLSKRSEISLYASRGQDNSRSYIPTTQQTTFRQDLGFPEQNRSLIGNMMSPQSLIESKTANESSLYKTPIQNLKYYSPSPSGQKLTESILKQEQTLSKYEAQSPQVFKKEDTSRVGYKYFYGQQQKPEEKK